MEQREIEIAIGELEERVDRLRVLYEQYFLGFEKLEPTVPRKDVDRRFALLRKENIRNTALRFRFNVVTQKYNTYAMHWTRICRQIEEGTFKRHVRRAKERFGDAKPSDRDRPDSSLDVEVDFEDLESTDLEALLAEADRAAAKFERPPVDTAPPPAAPAMPMPQERIARPAPLPAGAAKPLLVRKVVKAPGAPPAPSDRLPAAPASAPSGRMPAAPTSAPSGRMPAAPTSAPSGRMPAAPAPASSGRMPAPPAPAPSGRMPAAPAPAPSGRMPAPPPPAPSGRMPAAPPPSNRLPLPPASAPGLPVRPPAGSVGRVPVAPPAGQGRPMIRPMQRPPSPSQPDVETAADRPPKPGQPAGTRPRPPLPSQSGNDDEK